MLLFDIGNTSVTFGIAQKGRIIQFGSFLFEDFPFFIKKCSHSGLEYENKAIISSVVPKNTLLATKVLRKYGYNSSIVGKDLKVPLRVHYRKGQLGNDRLVTAYGGFHLYGGPLLVIDFGTAITFDYISAKGVFEGGLIVPGPEISFQALVQRAALLPKKTRLPNSAPFFIGKDSLSCMKAGILQGYGALTEGVIRRFQKRYDRLKIVGTGGFAKTLRPFCPILKKIDPQLSVKSLLMLAQS